MVNKFGNCVFTSNYNTLILHARKRCGSKNLEGRETGREREKEGMGNESEKEKRRERERRERESDRERKIER